MRCGDMLAQQLSVGSGSSPRATAVICHLCSSLLSACWCNAEQWIRLAAGTARRLQYRLTSHLSNENRLGLAVKQVNYRWKAVQH